jgi:hypothetical protein
MLSSTNLGVVGIQVLLPMAVCSELLEGVEPVDAAALPPKYRTFRSGRH